MKKLLVLVLTVCISCVGLGEKMAARMGYVHVELTIPAATAPESDRIAAYKELRLDKFSRVETNGYIQNTIQLADGTKIYYPADLKQVVAADSETAARVARAETELKTASRGGGRAALSFVGGFLLFAGAGAGAGFLALEGKTPQAVTVGVLGVGVFTFGIVSLVRYNRRYHKYSAMSSEEIESATASYNQDLLKQLNLCVDSKKIVFACEKEGGLP